MATVKSYTARFAQSDGSREFKVKVNCNASGEFSIALPADIKPVTGKTEVTGSTLLAVERALEMAIDEYNQAKSKRRKVICYNLGISCHIMTDESAGAGCAMSRGDISFANGTTIMLFAGVYEEEEITDGGGGTRYNYYPVASSIPKFLSWNRHGDRLGACGRRESKVLDWTPEREEFFSKIAVGMKSLMFQLDCAFKDPAALALIADSGCGLLGS